MKTTKHGEIFAKIREFIGDREVTADEVAAHFGTDAHTARSRLKRMVETGKLLWTEGKRGRAGSKSKWRKA